MRLHKTAIRCVALCMVLCIWLGLTAATTHAAEVVILWTAQRPAFIAINLDSQGEDHRAQWHEAVQRLFDAFDSNDDGALSADERVAYLLEPLSIELEATDSDAVSSPPAGKMDLGALSRYLTDRGLLRICLQSPGPFIAVKRAPGSRTTVEMPRSVENDVLVAALDLDRDGKLSRQEWATAAGQQHALDRNDDEQLSARELQIAQGLRDPSAAGVIGASSRLTNEMDPGPRLTLLPIAAGRRSTARDLLARYDDNQDGLLNSQELGISAEQSAALDRDNNGGLDGDELIKLLSRPPIAATVDCHGRTYEPAAARLEIGDYSLCVRCSATAVPQDQEALLSLFKQQDKNQNQYLEPAEAAETTVLKPRFRLMDRDGDDKIFAEEFLAYAQCIAPLAALQTVIGLKTRSRNVFEAIDQNRDSRLSRLELLRHLDRLPATEEINAAGRASVSATLHVSSPASWLLRSEDEQATAPPVAPRWFLSMDANGDGAVSMREFLPPYELFRKLDGNGDGLIEPSETADSSR